MSELTKEQYEQQAADCDGLCVISEEMLEADPNLMKCVRCPFCEQIVNAIITAEEILCPECKATAKR